MHIYFSGIGGVAIGPLAEIAHDAGYEVVGSDANESSMTRRLQEKGIDIHIGQDGSFIADTHAERQIDWFVYTSALPKDHPELQYAADHGIRTSKRDELIAKIIEEKNLQLVAVAGTHGKTTTTGMVIWLMKQLGIPVSYSVGTTLQFGPSGTYDPKSAYFVYECDEYDRNFLHFSPHVSIVTAIGYDHPDIFPDKQTYFEAFRQFINQSEWTYLWEKDRVQIDQSATPDVYALSDTIKLDNIHLAGEHMRRNARLAAECVSELCERPLEQCLDIVSRFPGTDRRFERLADGLYSDYGHHPTEIAATIQLAKELNPRVVVVYQPHQNRRQHEVKELYKNCFSGTEKVYWLPTYLSREDPDQHVLTSEELGNIARAKADVATASMDDELWQTIQSELGSGALVLAFSAGSLDAWLRAQLGK